MTHKRERGFTLIEVMVSLLIFSTAILGLIHAGTENIRSVQIIEQKHIAGIIADNQLILALATQEERQRETATGNVHMAGHDWQWKRTREATQRPGFLKINMSVSLEGEDQVVLSRQAFFRQRGLVGQNAGRRP
jgi:general secretion pathway protein I